MINKLEHIIFILLLYSLVGIGQNTPIKFQHITSENGLSQSTVPCIYKDKLGIMWFGTFDGLNKYNGSQITVYKNTPENPHSISDNIIKTIYEDEAHNLWISTSEGLNFFDRKTEKFIHYFNEKDSKNSLSHNHLTEITGDKEGNIWIGTLEGYLNKFDPLTKSFTHYPPPICSTNPTKKIEDINCLHFDQGGNLWIGYMTGQVAEFDVSTETYHTSEKLNFHTEVRCMKEDKFGNFWIGTDREGLKLVDKETKSVRQFVRDDNDPNSISDNTIWSIAEDNEDNLLIGTENGLNMLNLKRFANDEVVFTAIQYDPMNAHGLRSNFIRYVYHDSSSNITWLGNTETGVDVWNRKIQQFTHYHANGQITAEGSINTLNNQVVWSIWDNSDQYTWIGTSGGLNRLNRQTGEVIFYSPDDNNPKSISRGRCWNILQESENTYWVGTSTGLNKMTLDEKGQATFDLYNGTGADTVSSNSIRCMYIDYLGNFWVGTNKGLNLFDDTNNTFRAFYHDENNPQTLSNHSIRNIFQDSKKRLWIATSEGLNLYDYDSDTFSSILNDPADKNSISPGRVRGLIEDRQGQIWVGTSQGINKMIEEGNQFSFKHYTEEHGLPNNTIYGIREDNKGRLWVSTNHGLSRFDPVLETFTNFTVDDGLQDLEFNNNSVFKNKKGELFFGGVNGFNVFRPDKIEVDTSYAKVILTEFRLHNEVVTPGETDVLPCHVQLAKQINLKYSDVLFSLKYAALSYSTTANKSYAYRLKGWNDTWNYVDNQTTATYTNLPPRKYEFEVRAANKNGDWPAKASSIIIDIEPAIWHHPWFYPSLFIVGCFCVYLFYRGRLIRLQARQVELETRVDERTEELYIQNLKLEKANTNIKNTQAQLLESAKMASLGQLTAGIAHEINNPINFVAANVHALKLDFKDIQLLLQKIKNLSAQDNAQEELQSLLNLYEEIEADDLNEEIIPLINGIEQGAKRTQKIVASLGTFARNDNDEFAEADLHECLKSTLTILQSQFRDRITLHENYGDIPLVNCQVSKINQVFLNIIDNAMAAIQGEGELFISTEKVGTEVFIRIRDTGKGIEAEDLQQIFNPFFTTKEVGEGTGLGLTISYNIVKQHEGRIEVNSVVGEGTEFMVCLPIG